MAGRQAITWGVNYFWPVLDRFAPFPPQRIDREYKPGVDAVRGTVALGKLSQIDVVGAVLGSSVANDGSVAALGRVNLGAADVGLMLGRFHEDTVVGGFVTANVLGTGLRAEVAFTDSGDPADAELGRGQFWQAGVGVDRQLTATLSMTAELAWNGFGTLDPEKYPAIARTDRVRRGEVNALGQYYFGGALTWQAHPPPVARRHRSGEPGGRVSPVLAARRVVAVGQRQPRLRRDFRDRTGSTQQRQSRQRVRSGTGDSLRGGEALLLRGSGNAFFPLAPHLDDIGHKRRGRLT